MYRDRRIALVIPAYNEERLIGKTLEKVPPLFDRIFVVDDCSPDNQCEVVRKRAQVDPRIQLISHKENSGPGASIITGYLASAQEKNDVTVVVGGDDQMDLDQVIRFLDPLIDGKADYAKGNRFLLKELAETMRRMPKIRLWANWIITLLTKVASGYYGIMDVVDGYTAITLDAIQTIRWEDAWKKYGYPMDFLVRLNGYGFRVVDVPRKAIYTPGERQSQIKGFRYAWSVSPMLIRDFFWRLRFKYVYRSFHPLIFFYFFGAILTLFGFSAGVFLIWDKLFSSGMLVTGPKAILVALSLISGFQFLLFAMFFDMQEGAK